MDAKVSGVYFLAELSPDEIRLLSIMALTALSPGLSDRDRHGRHDIRKMGKNLPSGLPPFTTVLTQPHWPGTNSLAAVLQAQSEFLPVREAYRRMAHCWETAGYGFTGKSPMGTTFTSTPSRFARSTRL